MAQRPPRPRAARRGCNVQPGPVTRDRSDPAHHRECDISDPAQHRACDISDPAQHRVCRCHGFRSHGLRSHRFRSGGPHRQFRSLRFGHPLGGTEDPTDCYMYERLWAGGEGSSNYPGRVQSWGACARACTSALASALASACICIYMRTHARIYMRTCAHLHTHAHLHVQVQVHLHMYACMPCSSERQRE